MRALTYVCLGIMAVLALGDAALAQNANPASGGNIAVPAGLFGSRELLTVIILVFGIAFATEWLLRRAFNGGSSEPPFVTRGRSGPPCRRRR